ncbi:MAG: hypothetical protein LUD22_00305 [Coprobacillus sp.]|nr:hypothetical protein [Coprobacillus sp.]
MKKNKLLLSISACILLLSSCNSNNVGIYQESLTNCTLSVTFTEDEKETTLPDYVTAYIIGDWNWDMFYPLTEVKGSYQYTFPSLDVGTYMYKIVMWYKDEGVSWTNCVEITPIEQKFIVDGYEGNNSKISVLIPLTSMLEAPLSESDKVYKIIDSASTYSDASYLSFEAYQYENYSEDEQISYYLTSSSNWFTYGSIIDRKGESVIYSYLQDGYRYNYDSSDPTSASSYTKEVYAETFTASLNSFKEPFTFAKSLQSIDSYEYTLVEGTSSYSLIISDSTSVGVAEYIYYTDLDFNLVNVSYSLTRGSSTIASKVLEEITYDEVKATMNDFNINKWNEYYWGKDASNPSELMEKADVTSNYSLTIYYNVLNGTNTMTYGDYLENPTCGKEYLLSGMETVQSTKYEVYFMEDCCYLEKYELVDNDYVQTIKEVMVNDEVAFWDYFINDDDTFVHYPYLGASYQDYFYMYGEGYSKYDISTALTKTSSEEDYDTYSLDPDYKGFYFATLGADILFSSYALLYSSYFSHDNTYFINESQSSLTKFVNSGFSFTSEDESESGTIKAAENDFYAYVYNVGSTDKRETCYYYHNMYQAQLQESEEG